MYTYIHVQVQVEKKIKKKFTLILQVFDNIRHNGLVEGFTTFYYRHTQSVINTLEIWWKSRGNASMYTTDVLISLHDNCTVMFMYIYIHVYTTCTCSSDG